MKWVILGCTIWTFTIFFLPITASFTGFVSLLFFRQKQSDWIKNSIVTSRDSLKSCDEHITIRLVIFRYYSFYNFFFQGDIRFEIYSLWLLLLLRSYHARITYKLANQSELTETEDDFVFIYCIKQPWVASSIFVAPSAKIGIWIILRKVGCKSGNVQNWLISHCL